MFKIRDQLQYMLLLLGEAGTGKSVIIDVVSACFNNIGVVNESYEQKYGIAYLASKDIIVSDDLPQDIHKYFPKETFKSMVSNGSLSSAVKNSDAITIDKWSVPILFSSNYVPQWRDKGDISRRILCANFENTVLHTDTSIKNNILSYELPAFIYKSLLAYQQFINNSSSSSIWDLCPEYFLDQQQELKEERNPLFKFIINYTEYQPESYLTIEEIKERFSSWLNTRVGKLDNGTFTQVDKRFIIESAKLCKSCLVLHIKGCCEKYSRNNRTTKKK